MDMLGFLSSLMERISKLLRLYEIQQNETLDETQKVALKDFLGKVAADIVQSLLQTIEGRSSALALIVGTQQQGRLVEVKVTSGEREKCVKCGEVKRLKTAEAKVMAEQNVVRRFIAAGRGRPGDNKTQRRTSSPPSVAGKEVVCYQPRENEYRPPQDFMLPSLMKFDPSVAKARHNQGSIMCSHNSMVSAWVNKNAQRSSRRSTSSSISVASSSTVSNHYSVSSTEDHRKYQRSHGSSTSSYAASSTGSLTHSANSSVSSTRSEESDAPPQRTDRHHKYRSTSRKRRPQTHYSCSTRSSTCNSSPEEEYSFRRRSQFSEVHPRQKKLGRFRRVIKNLASMFHRNHRDDSDASSPKEDRNAQKPVGNGKLHCKSKEKLERAVVTANWVERHAVVCTLNWLGRALPNNSGEARLKIGSENKHTQLKGRHKHKK
ncbi:hypothetical protein MKW94_020247 [Papaver nudicaule]|uniref:Uncharacterized protein n=1 Tax=Papaver nudicaule TaxID=74823 RepID=A0AA41SHB7_PAPNU|nr:hypothetical protein [Papaver nudicaule]